MIPKMPKTSGLRASRAALRFLAPGLLLVMTGATAVAQDAEPPSLVGRIARIRGDVSMLRAGQPDWTAAEVNAPVSVGDAVYAQNDADARLQIGATDLDLKSDSEIDVAALDQDDGRIRLDSGTLDLRVSALPTADGLPIATPRGVVRLTRNGVYRIYAGSDSEPTRVTVWSGGAQVGDGAGAVPVAQGQTLVVAGSPDAPHYSYLGIDDDYPAEWRRPARVVSADQRYVPPDMTGSEDLYDYGTFETVPDYGAVWYPTDVPPDWQPYRYGHWEYVAPWGQTWIDDQPWGFAPFHYGRWARIGNRWGWCPGAYAPHPVYAPALVAFIGGGGFGVSIGFGGDAVGWVPLGPGERYRPSYRASNTYIENINRTTIVNNRTTIFDGRDHDGRDRDRDTDTAEGFANRRFATVVPADVVSRARPVSQGAINVRPEQLDHARIDEHAMRDVRPMPATDRPQAKPGPVRPPEPGHDRPGLDRPSGDRPGGDRGGQRPGEPTIPPVDVHPGDHPPDRRDVRAPVLPPAPPPPRGGRPENGHPDSGHPELGRSGSARPDGGRPMTDRPAPLRPDAARPAPARPEARPEPRMPRPEPAPRPEMRQSRPEPAPRPEPQPRAAPPAPSHPPAKEQDRKQAR